MIQTTTRQAESIARIDGNVTINETEGIGYVRTYTDAQSTQRDIERQIQRLKCAFDFSDANGAELSLYAFEKKLTGMELQDMVTSIIQTHQFRKVTIAEIISQHQPNVKLVSGYYLRNMPTEKADAEYVKILRHNGMLYYAERSRIDNINERQKEVLRNIYRKNFK